MIEMKTKEMDLVYALSRPNIKLVVGESEQPSFSELSVILTIIHVIMKKCIILNN